MAKTQPEQIDAGIIIQFLRDKLSESQYEVVKLQALLAQREQMAQGEMDETDGLVNVRGD